MVCMLKIYILFLGFLSRRINLGLSGLNILWIFDWLITQKEYSTYSLLSKESESNSKTNQAAKEREWVSLKPHLILTYNQSVGMCMGYICVFLQTLLERKQWLPFLWEVTRVTVESWGQVGYPEMSVLKWTEMFECTFVCSHFFVIGDCIIDVCVHFIWNWPVCVKRSDWKGEHVLKLWFLLGFG